METAGTCTKKVRAEQWETDRAMGRRESVLKENGAGCLGSAHLRFLCTLFRTSGGWGSKADERVIYEQTGHQDGVVRKLWRSVWTCG